MFSVDTHAKQYLDYTCKIYSLPFQSCTQITFANSVDPDEMARDEPSHQDLYFLLFYSI